MRLDSINRRSLLNLQIIWLAFVFLSYFWAENNSLQNHRVLFNCMVFFSLVLGVLEIRKLSGTWLSLTLFFIITLYLFHHGHHILDFFGISIDVFRDYIMTISDNESANKGSVYSLLSINALQLGCCFSLKHNKKSNERIAPQRDNYSYIKNWAIVLLIISFIPAIWYDANRILLSRTYDYGDIYKAGLNVFSSIFSGLFEISLFALLYVNRDNKKWKYIYYPKLIWELLKLVTIGNRMAPISSILMFIFFKKYVIDGKTKNKENVLKYVIFGLVGFLLMGIVSYLRSYGSAGMGEKNFLLSFVTESGTSLLDMTLLMELMPSQIGYVYGLTYLQSFLIAIPFSGSIFGSNLSAVSFGSILNTYWDNEGLGGSCIAESYYNFGWFGIIYMFVLGIALSKLQLKYFKMSMTNKSPLFFILATYVMEQVLIYPRGYFYSIFQNVSVAIYATIIIIPFMYNSDIKNKKIKYESNINTQGKID